MTLEKSVLFGVLASNHKSVYYIDISQPKSKPQLSAENMLVVVFSINILKPKNGQTTINDPTILPHFSDQNRGLRSAINADIVGLYSMYKLA
jgi:hypothetical protein